MRGRRPPAVSLDTPSGPYVDLDKEEVYLADGTRLTAERAAQIVEDVLGQTRAESRAPGRKPRKDVGT